MASIKFIYRSKKSASSLTLRLSHKKEIDIFINTEYITERKFWFDSKNKQSIYPKGKCEKSLETKDTIVRLENFIYSKFNEDYKNIIIDKSWLQDVINIFFNRIEKNEEELSDNLIRYITYYIDKAPTIRNSKGDFGLSKSRVDDFKIIKKFITEFQGNRIFKVKDVNLKFRDDFVKWMIDDKKYATGYAGRMLGGIKTICNDAVFNGIEAHPQLVKVCGYKAKNKYIIFLTPDELVKIKNVNLEFEYLENARKWLRLGCTIGQRAGDLLDLTDQNIFVRNQLEVIELRQQKTGKQVTIPLLEEVKIIIKDGFPHKISLQKFNDYMKEICQLAGIDTITQGTIFNKSTKRKEYGEYEKWRLVSSHICRRTFCSNNFGILPNYLIMSVTGHQSEKTFLGYIGKTSYDYAQQFKDLYEKSIAKN